MRLEEKFKELKERKEKALIGFVTAGYPTAEDTREIARAMVKGRVDILELGLPFSDPIADGVTIQRASERSLEAGMNTDVYFEVAAGIKGVEKVCLTYYNLVLQRGLEDFIADCESAGIKGLVVPDLPVEESKPLLRICDRHETDLIFLIAPTTTEKRMARILDIASGFVYVVSLLGVTGAREQISDAIHPLIRRIREVKTSVSVPLAVGFGISKPEHVRTVCEVADGAIVGSAFIRLIEKGLESKSKPSMLREIEEYTRSLKTGTKIV
uniref:Tryptophan synthase alpha chain n=1 Tax=Candidatus Methanophagaceae archaeon ANME-1 ERB6 TaxID=2759912 RepID=A0A7G9YWC7_9EURY|nr:tryptophan synthase alpha chain [Methanosarcinales archaeon ANME-1 ERB6]